MATRGRKNRYETDIKPNLPLIQEMARTMTEKQIADSFGVSYTGAWSNYKQKYPELVETLKKGRQNLVAELKSTLIKKARGFEYEEKKIIKENGVIIREEINVKYSPPDVAAINLALKNYDRENWANDPQTLELKRKELELREKQIENNSW